MLHVALSEVGALESVLPLAGFSTFPHNFELSSIGHVLDQFALSFFSTFAARARLVPSAPQSLITTKFPGVEFFNVDSIVHEVAACPLGSPGIDFI